MSMPPSIDLRRRALWSGLLSLALWLSTSARLVPSVPAPARGFSLHLENVIGSLWSPTALPLAATALEPTSFGEAPAASIHAGRLASRSRDRYLLAMPFGREIRDAARHHHLDSLLLASVVEAESDFRADAVSNKGAIGLMQLMPPLVAGVDRPLDPRVNLDLGAEYLAALKSRYRDDLELALAAYHAGPGAVDRFGGLPPFRDTQHYVGRVLDLYREHRATLVGPVPAIEPGTEAASGEPVAPQRGS